MGPWSPSGNYGGGGAPSPQSPPPPAPGSVEPAGPVGPPNTQATTVIQQAMGLLDDIGGKLQDLLSVVEQVDPALAQTGIGGALRALTFIQQGLQQAQKRQMGYADQQGSSQPADAGQ